MKKKSKQASPKKKIKPQRAKLIKEADRVYSQYVRQKYADKEGVVQCYTCPYQAHWKKMQNGHYITRSAKYTRWDLDNLRPQCFVCNMRNQGMGHIFREKLVGELGEEHIKAMEQRSKQLFKEPDEWILERITTLHQTSATP